MRKKKIGICRHVIKRKGHQEIYDEKKVYASVYSAALNCHYSEKKSEKLAERVMKAVNKLVESKRVFNSSSIRNFILGILERIDSDVALMYEHYLDLS